MEENKLNISQKLAQSIEAYADAKVSQNNILIDLAIKNLNTLLESLIILTEEDRTELETSIKEKDQKIMELEARVKEMELVDGYPDDLNDGTRYNQSSIEQFATLGEK